MQEENNLRPFTVLGTFTDVKNAENDTRKSYSFTLKELVPQGSYKWTLSCATPLPVHHPPQRWAGRGCPMQPGVDGAPGAHLQGGSCRGSSCVSGSPAVPSPSAAACPAQAARLARRYSDRGGGGSRAAESRRISHTAWGFVFFPTSRSLC